MRDEEMGKYETNIRRCLCAYRLNQLLVGSIATALDLEATAATH